MKDSILSYVHFLAIGGGQGEIVDPSAASSTSNTGDPTLAIIACLFAVLAVVAGVFFLRKLRCRQASTAGALHVRKADSTSLSKLPQNTTSTKFAAAIMALLAIFAIFFGVLALQHNSALAANAQGSANDEASLVVDPLIGTVDLDAQTVSIAPSKIKNTTQQDIYVDGATLVKLADIKDDDCTWTLKVDGKIVFEGKAEEEESDSPNATNENSETICVKAGASSDIELSQSGLSFETAKTLVDKDALKMSVDYSSLKIDVSLNDTTHGNITSDIPAYAPYGAQYYVDEHHKLHVEFDDQMQYVAEYEAVHGFAADYWMANSQTVTTTPTEISDNTNFVLYTKTAEVDVTTAVNPTGSGTINSTIPAKIPINEDYKVEDGVLKISYDGNPGGWYSASVTPASGYAFQEWTINDEYGERSITEAGKVSSNATFTAKMVLTYTVKGDGTDCKGTVSTESLTVKQGTTYSISTDKTKITFAGYEGSITYTPPTAGGWEIDKWTIDGTEAASSGTITKATTFKAVEKEINFQVSALADQSRGTISNPGPHQIQEGTTYSISDNKITINTATATVITYTGDAQWQFDKWVVKVDGKEEAAPSGKITGTTTFTAMSKKMQYNLSASVDDSTRGTIDPALSANYDYGTSFKVDGNNIYVSGTKVSEFKPTSGNELKSWKVNGTDQGKTYESTITGATTLVANTGSEEFSITAGLANAKSGTISSDPTTMPKIPYGTSYTIDDSGKIIFGDSADALATITFTAKTDAVHGYAYKEWRIGDTAAPKTGGTVTKDTIFTVYANEAYACYYDAAEGSVAAKTLYFYYDEKRPATTQANGKIYYDLNAAGSAPAWTTVAAKCEHAVVDTSFADYKPVTCQEWFAGMQALKEAPQNLSNIKTDSCVSLKGLFKNSCSALATLPTIPAWNTENVEDMSSMFEGYASSSTSITVVPDLSGLKVDKVTKFENLFANYGASSTEIVDIPKMPTMNKDVVVSLEGMFSSYAKSTTKTIIFSSDWDLGSYTKLTNTSNMFKGCGITTINCDKDWSTLSTKATSTDMFADCAKLVGGNGTTVAGSSVACDITNAHPDKGVTAGAGFFTPSNVTYSLAVNYDSAYEVDDIKWFKYKEGGDDEEITHTTGKAASIAATYNEELKIKPEVKYLGLQITAIADDNTTSYTQDDQGYITFPAKADLLITCIAPMVTIPYTACTTNTLLPTDDPTYDATFYNDKNASVMQKKGSTVTAVNLESGGQVVDVESVRNAVTKVKFDSSFNNTKVKSCNQWFYYFSSLTNVEFTLASTNIDFTECTTTNMMFANCNKLETLDVSFLNTANVSDMTMMFSSCSKLATINNLSFFITSNATTMTSMFNGCSLLSDETVEGVKSWITGNVQDMSYLFCGCVSLTKIDLSNWNTSYVRTMESMFAGTNTAPMQLTTINITNFSNDSLTNTTSMFMYCSSLNKILCNGWWNTSSILTSSTSTMMFYGCSTLKYYKDANNDYNYAHPDNGTDGYFFQKKYAITLSGSNVKWYDSSSTEITSIEGIAGTEAKVKPVADYSYGITSVSDNYGKTYTIGSDGYVQGLTFSKDSVTLTANVNYAYASFYSTASGEHKAGDLVFYFDNNSSSRPNAYPMNQMDSQTVPQPVEPQWIAKHASSILSVSFDEPFANYKPTVCGKWFMNCANVTSFNFDNLDTSECKYMSSMFSGCSSQATLDLTDINVANVIAMDGMFNGCSSLTSVTGLNDKDPQELVRAGNMFWNCTSLKEMDLSNWRMPKVAKLQSFFRDCKNLQTVYLTSYNPSTDAPLSDTQQMFNNCESLTNIYCNSDWRYITNLTSSSQMFDGASKLPNYNSGKITKDMAYPNDGSAGYFSKHVFTITTVAGDGMVWKNGKTIVTQPIEVQPGSSLTLTPSITENTRYFIDSITDDLGKTYSKTGDITLSNINTNLTITCKTYSGYACYYNSLVGSHSKGSFVFYCDDQRSVREGQGCSCFDMNGLSGGTAAIPGWATSTIKSGTTNVTMDSSFANYHPKVCGQWFNGFTNSSLSFDFTNLNTDECENMSSMFANCTNITQLDVSSFNTSNVTRMDGMFSYDTNLTYIKGLSNLDTKNVQYMGSMFKYDSKLTSLDLTNWKPTNLLVTQGMFDHCELLTQLNLSNFSYSNITSVVDMFAYCYKLETIKWDANLTGISASVEGKNMFNNCSSLVGGNGTKYQDVYKDTQYARPDKSGQAGYFTATS